MNSCRSGVGSPVRSDRPIVDGVPTILAVSGSLRSGSSNSAALRTAAAVAASDVRVVLYDGLGRLPHFDPDDDRDPLPGEVTALRHALDAADAVLFSTPEYAGTLPGSFKNLLDWCVGGTGLNDKPTGWINVAAYERGGQGAVATLRTVLGYVTARVIDDACAHIPVQRSMVSPDGTIHDETVRAQIDRVIDALTDAAAGHTG